MKLFAALLLAIVAVPTAFGAGEASARNACPYVEPHEDAIARARALRAQRSATSDMQTVCQLLPQMADVEDEMASNLENAATHPNCREQKTGAGAAELRQRAQQNRQAAAKCSEALNNTDATRRSSGGCGSDITGTKGGAPAPRRDCDNARDMRRQAHTMAKSAPAMAKRFYREAADEYVAAGDFQLAALVLRELAALDQPSSSSSSSGGRSGSPPGGTGGGSAARPFTMWNPTEENKGDCGNASGVDKQTAAYYNTCVTPDAPKEVSRYTHPITPQTLSTHARTTCGSFSRDTVKCFEEAKMNYILAHDGRIRAQCESEADKPSGALRSELRDKIAAMPGDSDLDTPEQRRKAILLSCVDREYVWGPEGQPHVSLRDKTKDLQRERDREALRGPDPNYVDRTGGTHPAQYCSPNVVRWAPHPCCGRGFGMKPTPGGNGSWSCQQLGSFSMGNAKDLAAAEERLDEVAATAVAAADRNLSQQIDEAVREKCKAAVFAAVRSVLKGGQPIIAERCRAFADAARAELAYYAGRHIVRGDAAVEELLAYLPSGKLDGPLPGLENVTPAQGLDREIRELRVAECVARGGIPENCAAAAQASGQSVPPPRTFVRGGISP